MHSSVLTSALLATTVTAWLPHDRELQAFNQTVRLERLGKRFEPSLQTGINKIRGVNFGGNSILSRVYGFAIGQLTMLRQVGSSAKNG